MVTAIDKHTALVIIDLQKGLMGFPTIDPLEGVVAQSAALVAAFRKANQPIVYVNVDPVKFRDTRRDAKSQRFTPPEGFADIIPAIDPQAGDIYITKHTWGAFHETQLHEALQAKGVTGIVLCGVATSIGVEGTARQAMDLGYNITLAKDAMTDLNAAAQENSLNTIFPRLGEVDTTANIIALL